MSSFVGIALQKIRNTYHANLYIAFLILSGLYSANFLLEFGNLWFQSENTEQSFSDMRVQDVLSDSSYKGLASLKENLFGRHCALLEEVRFLKNKTSENYFLSSLKWRKETIVCLGGSPHINNIPEFKKIWTDKKISFEVIQKKNTFYQLVCSFDIESNPVSLPYFDHPVFIRYEQWLDLCSVYDLELLSWKSIGVSRGLSALCDKIIHIKFSGSWDDLDSFLATLENQGWILGRKGHICAKKDALVFDLELLHLC